MSAAPPNALWLTVPRHTKASECRGCGARIFWGKTRNDKNVPIDCTVDGAWEPDGTRDGYGVSHFQTCTKANQFSGTNRGK